MSNEKYLVTSASGKTGYHVARQLLDNGKNVRIMSRGKGKVIQELESLGAEAVIGDISKREDMKNALSQVNRVYYCYPLRPDLLSSTTMFAELAQQEKINGVVNVGQYLSNLDTHPSKQTSDHKLGYKILDDANIGACHVTPGFFADNIMSTALVVSQLGSWPFPVEQGRCPVVSSKDIARVAVSILENPIGHEGQRYQPTGPKSLSVMDIMETFDRVLGRKTSKMQVSDSMFNKSIIQNGFDPYSLSQIKFYIDDYENSVFDYAPTDVVLNLTGSPAEDFEVTAKRHFEQNGLMNKSLSGRMKAMKQFIQILLTKAPTQLELTKLNQ